jgi:hypothetical protein
MTKKKPDEVEMTPAVGADDDTLADKEGTVRTVTIVHIPHGEKGVQENIKIGGYPPQAVATLMTDMTSAFVSILCRHVPPGTAKMALLRTFLPAAMSEIDRYEKKNGIEGGAMDNMLGALMTQLAMGGRKRNHDDEDDEKDAAHRAGG